MGLGMSKCKNPGDFHCPQTELDCNPERFPELRACGNKEEESRVAKGRHSSTAKRRKESVGVLPCDRIKDATLFNPKEQSTYLPYLVLTPFFYKKKNT